MSANEVSFSNLEFGDIKNTVKFSVKLKFDAVG